MMGEARNKFEANIHQQRADEYNKAYRRSIPLRILKGLTGVAFIVAIPFALFIFCFKDNQWPWEM